MDIELLKSTPDDQIEMMLMMHFDKSSSSDLLPSGGPYTDSPSISFSGNSNSAHIFDNTQLHHQQQQQQQHGHLGPNSFSTTIPTSQNPLMIFPNNGNGNGGSIHSLSSSSSSPSPHKQTSMAAMREMIFRIAAMQPIYIDPESVKPPKRRNVRISKDPQSVAARHRRERISERIRILQRLVPGGTKMDTASMLDEAIHYVKFLKNQVQSLERAAVSNNRSLPPVGFPIASGYFPVTGGSKANYSLSHPTTTATQN